MPNLQNLKVETMKTVCLFCQTPIKLRSWLPFAPCLECKQLRQVVFVDGKSPADSLYFDSYMINFYVNPEKKQCVLQTSEGNCRFPMPKRKDAYALTRLLYSASQEYNVNYVSEDDVKALVENAIDSYWYALRTRQEKRVRSVTQA